MRLLTTSPQEERKPARRGLLLPLTLALTAGLAGASTDLSGSISDDTTGPLLAGEIYHLVGNVTVPTGKTLTIEAGAILKGAAGTTFFVQGTLLSQGTSGSPVVMTSLADDSAGGDTNGDGPSSGTANDWRGLYIYGSAVGVYLEYTTVEYSGHSGYPGIDVFTSDIYLYNCIVSDCGFDGLDLNGSVVPSQVENCAFQDNGRYAVNNVRLESVPNFLSNTASGNATSNCLRITTSGQTEDLTIAPINVLEGALIFDTAIIVPLDDELRFEAGVVTKWAAGTTLLVNGTLVVDGSPGSPVVFTSQADDDHGGDTNLDGPSTGTINTWRGIFFYSTADGSSLDHAIVRFSGQSGYAGVDANTTVLTLTNVTIRDCGFDALDLSGNFTGSTVSDCTFQDCGRYAVANLHIMDVPAFSGNTATGNAGGDYMRVTSPNPTSDVTINASNILEGALVFTTSCNVGAGITLTLNEGVIIKWPSGATLLTNGTLISNGSASLPVVLTTMDDDEHGGDTGLDGPTTGTPGTWRGAYFYASADGSSLTHTIIRFSGNSGYAGVDLNDTDATLTNVTIDQCSFDALDLSSTTVGATITNCTLTDCGRYAVGGVPFSAVPDFSGNLAWGNAGGDFMRVAPSSPSGDLTIDASSILNGALVMTSATSVPTGMTLTLNAGTVLKWESVGASLLVNGVLNVNGYEDKPVVMTSLYDDDHAGDTDLGTGTATPGAWRGIYFYAGGSGDLSNLLVRYPGASAYSGVRCYSPAVSMSCVRVDHAFADGFTLHAGPAEFTRLCAWDCGGQGVELADGAFTLRQFTAVGCAEGIERKPAFTGAVKDCIAWSNTTNYDGFAAGELSYSNGSAAHAGSDGNINTDPLFLDPSNGDFELDLFSPCVNTGDPNSPDDPDLTRADMGAYFANHCRPQRYCVGKLNSLGCKAKISWEGYAQAAGGQDNFYIRAENLVGQTTGMLTWSLTPNPTGAGAGGNLAIGSSPFGMRRCLLNATTSGVLATGGTAGSCDGTFDFLFSQQLMLDNGLGVGTTVYAQFVYSDPAHPDGSGIGYTDAISFSICP